MAEVTETKDVQAPDDGGMSELLEGFDAVAKPGQVEAPPPPDASPPDQPPSADPEPDDEDTPEVTSPDDPEAKVKPIWEPKKASDWKTIKAARDQAIAERDEIKAKLASIGNLEELQKASTELAELRKQFRMVAADRDPETQKVYHQRKQSVLADLKTSLNADVAEEVIAAMDRLGSKAGPTLKNIAEKHELSAWEQTELTGALSELRSIERERAALIEQSVANWDRLQQEQLQAQQQQSTQILQQVKSSLNAALEDAAEHIAYFNPKAEGDLGKQAAQTVALARHIATEQLDVDEQVNAAMRAAAYGPLANDYAKLSKDHAELQAKLKKLQGTSPTTSGSKISESDSPPVQDNEDAGAALIRGMREAGIDF